MKPYQYLCSVSKDGVLYHYYKHKGKFEEYRIPATMEATNLINFSQHDLNAINRDNDLFTAGKLPSPNCNTCKERFICWTNNMGRFQ